MSPSTATTSPPTRVFLSGATGYLGGEVLHRLTSTSEHRNTVITCLVRDASKADLLRQTYPQVQILLGDLDDDEKIRQHSAASDIVLNLASTKHIKSAQAIAKGLKERTEATNAPPAFWIQISGASLFAGPELKAGRFGEHSDEVWDDVRDVPKIRSTINDSPAREVERLLLSSSSESIHTALLIGPMIYGLGNGLLNKRSMQAPDIARSILQDGRGFRFNAGLNRWSTIHVGDLGEVVNVLVQAASADKSASPDLWNGQGIYLPATGIVSFGDLCQWIATEANAQGLIEDSSIDHVIDASGADKVTNHGSILLGTNAILNFARSAKIGWKSHYSPIRDTIAELVRLEAESLGMLSRQRV